MYLGDFLQVKEGEHGQRTKNTRYHQCKPKGWRR